MNNFKLEHHPFYNGTKGPLLFIIMDGVGLYRGHAEGYEGNAFDLAKTPVLDNLMKNEPLFTKLKAHGCAVGMPSDEDMGNSEVGHNAIGAGRVFSQGAQLVLDSIESRSLFEGSAWKELISNVLEKGSALHFIGLLSDGNVHSHIDHLFAMIDEAAARGVAKLYVHTLFDGRDVDEISAHVYLEKLDLKLAQYRAEGKRYMVASGGGRMLVTMDRYEADWSIVERGWKAHVLGEGRSFPDAHTALAKIREETGAIDQFLPEFVVVENGAPAGPIVDGDSVIFFNFRGDRAIEITRAFDEEQFDMFDRKRYPKVLYAGMMQYDGDLKLPRRFLVNPPAIKRTMSEYLAHNGVKQLAISETQKFGHVTYFWNGNNSEKFNKDLETWIEIPSDRIFFEHAPAMKAREITERVIAELEKGEQRFIRLNFANGDMVGHTGNLPAAIEAMQVVDECVGKLLAAAEKVAATVIITADHGNCDQMYEIDKKTGSVKIKKDGRPMPKTSHTLSPVPFIVVGPDKNKLELNGAVSDPGLGNIAATLLNLLGYKEPEDYLPGLLKFKG